jgi:purine-binding chemotaxis protein CheW
MESQQAANSQKNLPDQQGVVAFRLDNQTYAVPIESVVRIIEMVTITPIPQMSSVVEGVINAHGASVPVINLRRHFGLPDVAWGLRTPIILVQISAQTFGLIVDEVIDVLGLSLDQVSQVANILPEVLSEEPIIRGVVHIEGNTVLLLDVEYLLSPTHMQALLRVVKTLPQPEIEPASNDEQEVDAVDLSELEPEGLVEELPTGKQEGQTTMLVDGFEQGARS